MCQCEKFEYVHNTKKTKCWFFVFFFFLNCEINLLLVQAMFVLRLIQIQNENYWNF